MPQHDITGSLSKRIIDRSCRLSGLGADRVRQREVGDSGRKEQRGRIGAMNVHLRTLKITLEIETKLSPFGNLRDLLPNNRSDQLFYGKNITKNECGSLECHTPRMGIIAMHG